MDELIENVQSELIRKGKPNRHELKKLTQLIEQSDTSMNKLFQLVKIRSLYTYEEGHELSLRILLVCPEQWLSVVKNQIDMKNISTKFASDLGIIIAKGLILCDKDYPLRYQPILTVLKTVAEMSLLAADESLTYQNILFGVCSFRDKEQISLNLFSILNPVIWRYLGVANFAVRRNAINVLGHVFPLLDAHVTNEEYDMTLLRQVKCLEDALSDYNEVCRKSGIISSFRVLRDWWDTLSTTASTGLLSHLLSKNSFDTASRSCACAVLIGLRDLVLEQPLSHIPLKEMILTGIFNPSQLIYHSNQIVRFELVNLLYAISKTKLLSVFDFCTQSDIIYLLTTEYKLLMIIKARGKGSESISSNESIIIILSKLMLSSLLNIQRLEDQVNKVFALISFNPICAVALFSCYRKNESLDYLKLVLKLVVGILRSLIYNNLNDINLFRIALRVCRSALKGMNDFICPPKGALFPIVEKFINEDLLLQFMDLSFFDSVMNDVFSLYAVLDSSVVSESFRNALYFPEDVDTIWKCPQLADKWTHNILESSILNVHDASSLTNIINQIFTHKIILSAEFWTRICDKLKNVYEQNDTRLCDSVSSCYILSTINSKNPDLLGSHSMQQMLSFDSLVLILHINSLSEYVYEECRKTILSILAQSPSVGRIYIIMFSYCQFPDNEHFTSDFIDTVTRIFDEQVLPEINVSALRAYDQKIRTRLQNTHNKSTQNSTVFDDSQENSTQNLTPNTDDLKSRQTRKLYMELSQKMPDLRITGLLSNIIVV